MATKSNPYPNIDDPRPGLAITTDTVIEVEPQPWKTGATCPWNDLSNEFYTEPDMQSVQEQQKWEREEPKYKSIYPMKRVPLPKSPPATRTKIPIQLVPGIQSPSQGSEQPKPSTLRTQNTTTSNQRRRPQNTEEYYLQLGIWTHLDLDQKHPNIPLLNTLLQDWTLGNPTAASIATNLAQKWNLKPSSSHFPTITQVKTQRQKDLAIRLEARYQTELEICAKSGAFGGMDYRFLSREEQKAAVAEWRAANPALVAGLRKMYLALRRQAGDDEFYLAPSGFLARWEGQRGGVEVECFPYAAEWLYREEVGLGEEKRLARSAADKLSGLMEVWVTCWPVTDGNLARAVEATEKRNGRGLGRIVNRGISA